MGPNSLNRLSNFSFYRRLSANRRDHAPAWFSIGRGNFALSLPAD